MLRNKVSRREDLRALRTLSLSQDLESLTLALSNAMWERESKLPLLPRPHSSVMKRAGSLRSWSKLGSAQLGPHSNAKRGYRSSSWGSLPVVLYHWFDRQHQLQGQFLNNDAFLLLYTHSTKEGHSSMTVPKVTWSVVFSKIVCPEPTGWENAKICISLKCDAIFELLIEKHLNCK